jgi:hypothetical protein
VVGQNVGVPPSYSSELAEAFVAAWSSSLVMAQAGPRVFSRGVVYQRDRRVEVVESSGSRVSAVVRGTIPYSVTIGVEDGSWVWSCACPAAEDGDMCKHVVATALAATHGDSVSLVPSVTTPPTSDAATAVDVGEFVSGLDHDELVALVLAQVESDWRLRVQLLARAAAATSSPIDERAWRRRIESAFAPYDDYVHYREAAGWARDVDEMLKSVGDLIETHPAQAIALLEHAYGQANAAMQWIDDSDGYLTTIAADIGEFHLAACEAARPDPAELARRLVDLELDSELDAFHRAAATYADVLGVVGLAEYRRLIEPDWDRSTADGDRSSSGNFGIREAMIGVALASGDPDELIRVRSRSLQLPDDYLEIINLLTAAGRTSEAIEWGQRGLFAMADRTWQTPPLREMVAGLLRESGDIAGAVSLFEDEFRRSPSLTVYRRVLDEADLLGQRSVRQTEAITFLRARVAGAPKATRPSVAGVLIEILLFDGQIDEAWVVAVEHGCSEQLWLSLAATRQQTHPLDAIPIYRRAALAAIDTKSNRGYETGVTYLAKIRQLAQQAGEPSIFVTLLAEVRTAHKPKRNLMALLDRKRW